MTSEISAVDVALVRCPLAAPVIFGDWVMVDREYAVVRVTLRNGLSGWSHGLTRDGSVADQISRMIAPHYMGTRIDSCSETFDRVWRSSPASYASGLGLRALSLVDLACWDARARLHEVSIATLLGGEARPMPATAIVGYPPAEVDANAIATQVEQLAALGWARFKAPVSPSLEESVSRLAAIRSVAPGAWVGCDGAWTFGTVDSAVDFADSVADLGLGWFEDIFAPGDIDSLVGLRSRSRITIAMGDEQGGSYYPSALIQSGAVDVIRIDLTCMGGITGGRRVVAECQRAGIAFAPHMFPHLHSQVFSAWGFFDAPIEWGVAGTGVDPYGDSLAQPVIAPDGRMEPLPQGPGFGPMINYPWAAEQSGQDPAGVLLDPLPAHRSLA